MKRTSGACNSLLEAPRAETELAFGLFATLWFKVSPCDRFGHHYSQLYAVQNWKHGSREPRQYSVLVRNFIVKDHTGGRPGASVLP
jgi:hypothetical protein